MFPIPFNFPFRKKDGSLTTMDDAISSGGGSYTLPTASGSTKGGVKIGGGLTMTGEVLSANAQVPAYSESESGKVLTVNASGELEWDTKGSGGGSDAMITFDFTKWGNRTFNNVTYSENGASFENQSSSGAIYIVSPLDATAVSSQRLKNITLYVDVKELNLTTSQHRRFIMGTESSGFIYRNTGYWAFYSNDWYYSSVTDPHYFDNSKIKVYIDSDNYWHIYKDNVLVFEPNSPLELTVLSIGASSQTITGGSVTGARLYNGNYTEV